MHREMLPLPGFFRNHFLWIIMNKYLYLGYVADEGGNNTALVLVEASKDIVSDMAFVTLISFKQVPISLSMNYINQSLLVIKIHDRLIKLRKSFQCCIAKILLVGKRCNSFSCRIKWQVIHKHCSLLLRKTRTTSCSLNKAISRRNLSMKRLYRDIQPYFDDLGCYHNHVFAIIHAIFPPILFIILPCFRCLAQLVHYLF